MANWALVGYDGIVQALAESDNPIASPEGVQWVDVTEVDPAPVVGWLQNEDGTFSDGSAVISLENYYRIAHKLAKQAKPGLLNPATQAEALEGIRKGIAAILLLLLKSTELPE